MQTKHHSKSQFQLIENVEYKVINTRKFISLLQELQIPLSQENMDLLNLEGLKTDALRGGVSEKEVERLVDSCARDIFTENKLGKMLLTGIRKFVEKPITNDGVIRKGFLNELAANGVRIPYLTGGYGKKRNIKNLVTNAGFAGVASRINGAGSEAAFTYIAVGTGTTAAAAGNTTLETEIADSGLSRANSSASRVTTTQTNDTAQLVNTFTVTGTKAVTESGVLNASSNGVLLCRQVFSAINVVNGDSLQITWKIKAS